MFIIMLVTFLLSVMSATFRSFDVRLIICTLQPSSQIGKHSSLLRQTFQELVSLLKTPLRSLSWYPLIYTFGKKPLQHFLGGDKPSLKRLSIKFLRKIDFYLGCLLDYLQNGVEHCDTVVYVVSFRWLVGDRENKLNPRLLYPYGFGLSHLEGLVAYLTEPLK